MCYQASGGAFAMPGRSIGVGSNSAGQCIGLGFVITVIDTLARRSFDIEIVHGSQVSLLRGRANTIKFNKAMI